VIAWGKEVRCFVTFSSFRGFSENLIDHHHVRAKSASHVNKKTQKVMMWFSFWTE
jgi:peroxiredoxin family protein